MDFNLPYAGAKSLQSCLTLCNPIDSSPPGFPVPGILQARILEWVAISFSSAWKWKVKVKSLSCVRLLATDGLQPTRLFCPWDFPGKSTGVGCHCLLQKYSLSPYLTFKLSLVGCLRFLISQLLAGIRSEFRLSTYWLNSLPPNLMTQLSSAGLNTTSFSFYIDSWR